MSDTEKIEETKRLLLKADMELAERAEFEHRHKQAFRIAFDFLEACFPPSRSNEYWERIVDLFTHRVQDNSYNPLVKHLLLGVYNYISEVVKDLPEEETT